MLYSFDQVNKVNMSRIPYNAIVLWQMAYAYVMETLLQRIILRETKPRRNCYFFVRPSQLCWVWTVYTFGNCNTKVASVYKRLKVRFQWHNRHFLLGEGAQTVAISPIARRPGIAEGHDRPRMRGIWGGPGGLPTRRPGDRWGPRVVRIIIVSQILNEQNCYMS